MLVFILCLIPEQPANSPRHGRKCITPREETPESIKELDPNGDAILVVIYESDKDEKKLLVSSNAFRLASPVFKALLSRAFSERVRITTRNRPEITLKDNHPDAMRILLGAFHFKRLAKADVKMLAKITLLSDKYNCRRALRPCVEIWLERNMGTANAAKKNTLLLAALFFRLPIPFARLSRNILKYCTSEQLYTLWESDELYDILPRCQE